MYVEVPGRTRSRLRRCLLAQKPYEALRHAAKVMGMKKSGAFLKKNECLMRNPPFKAARGFPRLLVSLDFLRFLRHKRWHVSVYINILPLETRLLQHTVSDVHHDDRLNLQSFAVTTSVGEIPLVPQWNPPIGATTGTLVGEKDVSKALNKQQFDKTMWLCIYIYTCICILHYIYYT